MNVMFYVPRRTRRCDVWVSSLFTAVTAAACLFSSDAHAQGVFQFKLSPGEKLQYDSTFQHTVETRVGEVRQTSKSKVEQVRQWNVSTVDSLGVASMELTILKMTLERTDPDGKRLSFDSTSKGRSDERLWKQLSKAVGKPILRVQMAANGALKASEPLSGAKVVFPELPFLVATSDDYIRVGTNWERRYPVTLEAPFGKGEALPAMQRCKVSKVAKDRALIDVVCQLEKPNTDPTVMIALGQFLPKGQIVLDVKKGRLIQSVMTVDVTAPKFSGDDSEYKFSSRSTERLVDSEEETVGKQPQELIIR